MPAGSEDRTIISYCIELVPTPPTKVVGTTCEKTRGKEDEETAAVDGKRMKVLGEQATKR